MKQWFRGQLEAHYEGIPSAHPAPASDMRGRPHQIRIYRAQIRELALIEAPLPDATDDTHVLYQARVEHARLENHHKRGLCLEGPIFELTLSAPRLSHPARQGSRVFGRVEGTAVGFFEVPPEPSMAALLNDVNTRPDESAATSFDDRSSKESTEAVDERPSSVRIAPLDWRPETAPTQDGEPESDAVHRPPEVTQVRAQAPQSLPLFALVAALSLALLVAAGKGPAALWLMFVLPSLLVRRFLRGVLPDATAFRAIGAALMAAQLCTVSFVLLGWSSSVCKELHVAPLIGLVACVFLASVLPYLLPVAVNAVGFALVLGIWSAGPGEICGDARRATQPVETTPSVKHPGHPRTNEDGSWPRSPPGR